MPKQQSKLYLYCLGFSYVCHNDNDNNNNNNTNNNNNNNKMYKSLLNLAIALIILNNLIVCS